MCRSHVLLIPASAGSCFARPQAGTPTIATPFPRHWLAHRPNAKIIPRPRDGCPAWSCRWVGIGCPRGFAKIYKTSASQSRSEICYNLLNRELQAPRCGIVGSGSRRIFQETNGSPSVCDFPIYRPFRTVPAAAAQGSFFWNCRSVFPTWKDLSSFHPHRILPKPKTIWLVRRFHSRRSTLSDLPRDVSHS